MEMWNASKSGMVIAGRGARACDVCCKERARWYCAADEAYLCERCDGSVHSANSVARRHERVTLGPNGAPMKIDRKKNESLGQKDENPGVLVASQKWHNGSRKRSKSGCPRPFGYAVIHPLPVPSPMTEEAGILVPKSEACSLMPKEEAIHPQTDVREKTELPTCVKSEPVDPIEDNQSADKTARDLFGFKTEESELSHEVPIYEPLLQELIAASHGDLMEEILPTSPSFCNDGNGWGQPEGGCKVVCFPNSGKEPREPCEVEGDTGSMIEDGSISIDDVSGIDGFDVMDLCTSSQQEDEAGELELSDIEMWRTPLDCTSAETCMFGGNPFKRKGERQLEQQLEMGSVKLEQDAMPSLDAICREKDTRTDNQTFRKTISLQLNYEEVLNAWSGRGSFWMDGRRPQTVPDESFLEPGNFDVGLVPESSCNSSQAGEQAGQVPVIDRSNAGAAREARVMRYREKRRTRLFSKKIRYEVRKLNAERRPRMKGRFVKRSTIAM